MGPEKRMLKRKDGVNWAVRGGKFVSMRGQGKRESNTVTRKNSEDLGSGVPATSGRKSGKLRGTGVVGESGVQKLELAKGRLSTRLVRRHHRRRPGPEQKKNQCEPWCAKEG